MILPRLHEAPVVVIDTETTGLKFWHDKVFGVSITVGGHDFYWDVRDFPQVLTWLADEIPRCKKVVCHNAKFDWHMCREAGIKFPEGRVECTMVAAALIDEHLNSYDLDSLGHRYVGIGKDTSIYQELASLFGGPATKTAQMPNLQRAPSELVGRYAKQDSATTMKLWEWQQKEVERQGLHQVFDLEMRLLPVLVRMERRGVPVDVGKAESAVYDIDKLVRKEQTSLNALAGFEVNPNPSGSIKKLFNPQKIDGQWVLVDGTACPNTDGGAASINDKVLRKMKHPAAAMILNLRQYIKTRDTFLKGHILSHHDNGVIHANFNQTKSDNDLGTGTGRLSVNNPALQQIHKRNKIIAAIVRALFLPGHGRKWVCNDWSQMDFRVFAHYVNDKNINKKYEENPDMDFHQMTGDMTGLPRSPRFSGDPNAKQINLGLIFGMGPGKLAAEMGLPFTLDRQLDDGGNVKSEWLRPGPEATAVFDQYHAAIPGVRGLLQNAASVAKSRGFVRTIMGRHIRFPHGQFTYKAGGLIFQGSAADALKLKLIELDAWLESQSNGACLLLNVHDEFDTSIPEGCEWVLPEITRIVTDFSGQITFRVPIRSDQGVGNNWYEASCL